MILKGILSKNHLGKQFFFFKYPKLVQKTLEPLSFTRNCSDFSWFFVSQARTIRLLPLKLLIKKKSGPILKALERL